MKRFLILAILMIAPAGCSAPEPENPAPVATPTPSAQDIQVARDEAEWKALYNRVMKDYATKMIPKTMRKSDIEAARAVTEKDSDDLESIVIPPRFGRVHRSLQEGFRSLQSAHLYLKMGLEINDKGILESGRKELRAADAAFTEAEIWMQKVTRKPRPTPRPNDVY